MCGKTNTRSHVQSTACTYIVGAHYTYMYMYIHMLKYQTAPCASRENCSRMLPLFCGEKSTHSSVPACLKPVHVHVHSTCMCLTQCTKDPFVPNGQHAKANPQARKVIEHVEPKTYTSDEAHTQHRVFSSDSASCHHHSDNNDIHEHHNDTREHTLSMHTNVSAHACTCTNKSTHR